MIKRIIAIAAATVAATSYGVAVAAPVGIPEIDNADARFNLQGPPLTPKPCAGEDGINYVTWRGAFQGMELEVNPGSTDYNLSGPLNLGKIDWTVNQKTLRGLLTGVIWLRDSAGVPQYKGTMTLVTQQVAGSTSSVGRGWISANTYISGVVDGGSLLANIEVKLTTSSMGGIFGDLPGSMGLPNYSVTTINKSC